jgi:hypothetical protein
MAFDDLVSGTQWRIFRSSWRFGVHLLSIQVLLVIWLALAAAIGLPPLLSSAALGSR